MSNPIPWSSSLQILEQRFGDRVAVTNGADRSISYTQLNRYAHQLANYLIRVGVTSGQSIAVLLPNSCEAVWVSYGIRLLGACETPLAFHSTAEELAWFANVAQFTWVIATDDKEALLVALGFKVIKPQQILARLGPDVPRQLPPVEANAWGRLIFTSGTTGKPKGVFYTHGARCVGEQLQKVTLPFTPQPGERIVLMTPFIHGASLLTYAWCDLGGEVVLLQGVDLVRLSTLLKEHQVSAIFAPPTVLAKMVTAFDGQTFEGVKCIFTGTQPLIATLYQRACAMFGPVVRITYGKSECINPITVLDAASTHALFTASDRAPVGACVGWPAPGVEIRIGEPADVGEGREITDGEIFLRAPQMSSMLISPEGLIPHGPEGWHATGDLGFFDHQGRLVLTGRMADVIKTGGYRVNPDEIEALLSGAVLSGQICVTSLPSDYWGEIMIAVGEHTQDGWVRACQARVAELSKYKQPRLYLELPELPRNPQGKISRRLVRAAVLRRYQLTDGAYPALEVIG